MRIIGASIDLSKIDKSKIVEGKNGAKYYNFTILVNDEPNQFGKDVALTQEQTKEQRANKDKKEYIGSGKTVWKSESDSVKKEDDFKVQDDPNSSSLPF